MWGPCCQKEDAAKDPSCPQEGKFGNSVIALAKIFKYEDRLPHRKIHDAMMRLYRLKISPATILDLTRRAADAIQPEYDAILRKIRRAPILYVDETGIRVQGEMCWIWTFTTPSETFFVIRKSRGMKVLMEVSTILAEIGNYRDFSSPEMLASFFGLVPYVYQSAGKLYTGPITKQGSKHMRWILVQVARSASKVKGSRLKRFFLRIKARRGSNVATIALARKILCILYHLLINQEIYEEATIKKSKLSKNGIMNSSLPREMNLEDMIEVIWQSGYSVDKVDRGVTWLTFSYFSISKEAFFMRNTRIA